MKRAKLGVVLLLAVVLVASASVALADGRVALVVGNSSYAHIGRLPNPGNDAADMTAALRRLGFEVTTELDTRLTELNLALRAFTRRSAGADVSLVFYAGHGIEMNGVNYIVPVDARLERDTDVRFETVTLDDMLAVTSGAALRMVILDACRNNPLARSMQRTGASRSVSRGNFGDLDESLLGNETLVAYAAAAGTTAADGTGRNSPYTAALLEHLEEPLEILTLFRRVRAGVLASTNGEQRPHEYQSLLGEHYLASNGASGVAAAGTSVTVAASAPVGGDVADADLADLDVAQLRRIAEQGDAAAQTELGARYETGRGVARDYEEAVRWYRLAADQGHARGQASFGAAYHNGTGVSQDSEAALPWFRRAAEQGDARAQNGLGVLYEEGRGVREDHAEALRWYRLAADQGEPFAQNNLGAMYRDGRGGARGPRRIPPLVPSRRRPGKPLRPDQPRRHVPDRPGGAPGSCGSCPVVPLGRRPRARGRPEETGRSSVRIPDQIDHRFRRKSISESDPIRSLIPMEIDHRFRSKSITCHRS